MERNLERGRLCILNLQKRTKQAAIFLQQKKYLEYIEHACNEHKILYGLNNNTTKIIVSSTCEKKFK